MSTLERNIACYWLYAVGLVWHVGWQPHNSGEGFVLPPPFGSASGQADLRCLLGRLLCSLSFPVVLLSLPIAGCAVSAGVPTAGLIAIRNFIVQFM